MTYKASNSNSNENWVLVRTEVGDKLHELDVHLSGPVASPFLRD
jgi:hypothetical protein